MKKRLAIYVHHDKDGIVREYIYFCLKNLKKITSEIIFVVNGEILPEYKEKLYFLGITVLIRENKGFDWSAWKFGIEFLGYENISKYDELLLTNNTFYGPIYPFSDMWQIMDQKKCDFWGINMHPELDFNFISDNKKTKVNRHLQSYWIVFKNIILSSAAFKKYWQNIKEHKDYKEMVGYGELQMTNYFEKYGFKSEAYMNFTKYSKLINSNPVILTDLQVIEDKCPIIKRKYLFDDNFYNLINFYTKGDGPKKLMDFLNDKRIYNTELIWNDLLSTQYLSKINKSLNLQEILPTTSFPYKKFKSKIALIVYISSRDMIDKLFEYVKSVPDYINIIIVTTSKDTSNICQTKFRKLNNKIEYRIQKNRRSDKSVFFVTCADILKQYDYVGFIHAEKSPYSDSEIISLDFLNHCLTCLMYNKNYIENIINFFEEHPKIGLIEPLLFNSLRHKVLMDNPWTENYQNAKNFLIKKMKIKIDLDPQVMVAFDGMFWVRTKAIKTLTNYKWKFSDFPKEPLKKVDGLLTHAIERIIPLLIQKDGYYTEYVAPDNYASVYFGKIFNEQRKTDDNFSQIKKENIKLQKTLLDVVNTPWWKLHDLIKKALKPFGLIKKQ